MGAGTESETGYRDEIFPDAGTRVRHMFYTYLHIYTNTTHILHIYYTTHITLQI